MKKYLFVSVLCMTIGGHLAAFAAVNPGKKVTNQKGTTQNVDFNAKGDSELSSKINLHKADKFLSWYEERAIQGKIPAANLVKIYEKVKMKTQPSKFVATNVKKPAKAKGVKRPQRFGPAKAHALKGQAHQHSHGNSHYSSKSSHKHHHHGHNCLEKHIIEQNHFGKHGVVIKKPGYYCLSENVEYKACDDGVPAITIRSDNVILDLSTHVLSQSANSFDEFDDTSAIVVESGYDFVTIKNGQIKNFSNHGVLVQSENLGSVDDHHGIVIEDVIVLNCGKITTATDLEPYSTRFGIGVYGTTDCVILHCEASGISSLMDTEAIGMFFTDNIHIKDCLTHANRADPDEGFAEGVEINFFNNAIVEGCSSIKNTSSQTIGILAYEGTSLLMDNCQANENIADFPGVLNAFCAGIAIYFTDAATLTNSQGNFNVAQAELLGPTKRKFCTGIQAAFSGVEMQNCSANFNNATSTSGLSGGGCVGFDINSVVSGILKNCSAEGNTNYSIDETGGGGGVFGFDCDNASNVLLEDCVAIANNARLDGTPVKTGGFYASIFPEGGDFVNIVFKNCTSLNHTGTFEGTTVAGFLIGESPPTTIVVNPSQIIIDGCYAEGNINTTNPGNSAGISFENGTIFSSILHSTLKGNGIGILLRGTNTTSNFIESNEITANLVYGIQDATTNPNAYAKNYAYNPAAFANYTGLPALTPVRTWQVGFPPAPTNNNGILDPLDNISVTN